MSTRCRGDNRRKLEASNDVSRICMRRQDLPRKVLVCGYLVGSTAVDNHVVGGKEPGSKRHVLRLGSLAG